MSITPYHFEKTSRHETSGIEFRTVIEDYLFRDEAGETEASIYSYSYLAQPEKADKPVMFCYNGGPGASSNWVHMGLLGPKQVTFPDYPSPDGKNDSYVYGENSNFLLDCTDLVMINPPGTEMTFVREDAKAKYFSSAGDAEAIARFVQDWLKKYGRENASVWLLGESYGTLRNLTVADLLPEWVKFTGIVSIGTSFNVGSPTTLLVEPNVRRLGANAACCWYHYHQADREQREFIQEAMDFAYGEYAHALLMGNRLPAEEFEQTLEKLSYYTGMDRDLLRSNRLRFDEFTYLTKMMPGRLISMYDSRLTKPMAKEMTAKELEFAIMDEPFFAFADGKIGEGLARYIREDAAKPDDGRAETVDFIPIAMNWDYTSKDTLELPVELMQRYPDMRFLFAAGYYDLQSTFDFVTYYLGRYDLPMDRVTFNVYNTGHAAYAGGNAAHELCEDIRKELRRA